MKTPDNSILYDSEEGYNKAKDLYEAYLSMLKVSYKTQFVETPYGMTHVLLAGPKRGTPVVLLHGNSLFGPHMAHQINAIAQTYRVIVPDVIGCMGRSQPERLDRKGSAYGRWTASLLSALDISRGHMIGISNGAWLIIKLATVAPEMIISAVLMSAAGFVRTSWSLGLALFPVMVFGPLMSAESQSRQFLRQTSPPGFEPSDLGVTAMELVLRHYKRESVPGPLTDAELQALDAATYLLMGEFERPFPSSKVIKRAQAVMPNLRRTEILPGVAHGMVSENPELVNNRLLDWLAKCST